MRSSRPYPVTLSRTNTKRKQHHATTTIEPTESVIANQIASRFVAQISQLATQISNIRQNGIPEITAQPERQGPNGQIIPARHATPAVSAAVIDAALGEANCALLDALASAIND